jgi:hypothetical protein
MLVFAQLRALTLLWMACSVNAGKREYYNTQLGQNLYEFGEIIIPICNKSFKNQVQENNNRK